MDSFIIGVDIGGTKCSVVLGTQDGRIVGSTRFATRTDLGPDHAIGRICEEIAKVRSQTSQNGNTVSAVGVSCGGPLDSKRGIVLSPPNLPGWDEVPIVSLVAKSAECEAYLLNDADACAVAEYRFGAGRGASTMVFLTFGTGIGAGLILGGKLFSGSSGLAGEIGHVRIAEDGPDCYGKPGSLEGYCSGSGIARLAANTARRLISAGNGPAWCEELSDLSSITAESVAMAARSGDLDAREIYEISGRYLGRGCALLIDLLNPDVIVIGSIYVRCAELLRPAMQAELEREALDPSRANCSIVPADLGEELGNIASLCVAIEGLAK